MYNESYKSIVKKYLDSKGLRHETFDSSDGCRFKLVFDKFKGAYERLIVILSIDESTIQSIVYLPEEVSLTAMPKGLEIVARLNYNLKIGKFELNVDDGELKFQIGQDLLIIESPKVNQAIEAMLYNALYIVDSLSRNIHDAISGALPPSDILKRIMA